MSATDFSNLRRPTHDMPDFVLDALESESLTSAYQGRPAYQQNDYVGWITRAKREATRRKRLALPNPLFDRHDYPRYR